MKKRMRFLAVLLVAAMVFTCMPASAARKGSGFSTLTSWWDQLVELINKKDEKPDTGDITTPEPGKNEGVTSLKLVEDDGTVQPGTNLRASTYEAEVAAEEAGGPTLKYFPVTLYNYDQKTINDATHQAEVDKALAEGGIGNLPSTWQGIYFGDMHEKSDSYEYETEETVYVDVEVSYSNCNDAEYINGKYYVKKDDEYYVVTKLTCDRRNWGWGIYSYSWEAAYDGGTVTGTKESFTLYTRTNRSKISSRGYAEWNKWTGNLDRTNNGNQTYSGIAGNTLDANKNIQFNYPDAGIFTGDTSNKEVYTNVEMPFDYNAEDGYYTFDANEDGVYFHTDSTQGTSSEPSSNSRLYWNDNTPQSHDFIGQDGRTKGWFPYDDTTNVKSDAADYYFGMNATIPFSMTTNGHMNANDENSDPIKFEFSGDDDVWVFIDGVLVLDMGGQRNCLDGAIDFAENTFTISKTADNGGGNIGDAGSAKGANLSGKLFDDANGSGVLGMTRETFAATDEHNLTIFYLERGAGSSNCKIRFNLPMKDNVSVQKLITESKTDDGKTTPLTPAEKTMVDKVDFGFTLYKDGDKAANKTYILMNANGQAIATPSTDGNGHFTLKNGQTAKFVGFITENTYYVVEDSKEGYAVPGYTYTAEAANGAVESEAANGWTSMKVSAKGSNEAADNISFVCRNYLKADLPNPSIIPADDQIVIDYGLPVEIPNVLENDTWKGETLALTDVTGARYGTVSFTSDGKIIYTLNRQLSDVEVLTYTAEVRGAGESRTATGRVSIIPATSMYYEENFPNMVAFTEKWRNEGNADTELQESGVVGTVGDSPYGSDAAYLKDAGDSNGTSKYVNTTTEAGAEFSYTFTGMGTSFFARTTNNSGYMRVVIKQGNDTVYTLFRDTSYKTENPETTLYNIPVFTWEAENYGTYTVTVSLAKETGNYGTEFWLDGIRVMQPLGNKDKNVGGSAYEVALAAYAADGESNMTVATLRQALLEDTTITAGDELVWDTEKGFVVFTDSNGEIRSASEYQSNGPKEEVYLNEGQSVSFSLGKWNANSNKVYLGVKAPMGNGTIQINGHAISVENTADCYYNISDYADIQTINGVQTATFCIASSSGVISVTNIKVTGSPDFVIIPEKNVDGDGGEKVPAFSNVFEGGSPAAGMVKKPAAVTESSSASEETSEGSEEETKEGEE